MLSTALHPLLVGVFDFTDWTALKIPEICAAPGNWILGMTHTSFQLPARL